MSYKGETLAKKWARQVVWTMLNEGFSDENERHPVLVLASEVGGDVPVARSFGVDDRRLLAVDQRTAALARFSEAYPNVETFRGTMLAALKRTPRIAGAHLDYCGNLSKSVVYDVALALRRLRGNGIIAVNLLRGREHRSRIRIGGTTKPVGEWMRLLKAERPELKPYQVRLMVVMYALKTQGVSPWSLAVYEYQSGVSPMTTFVLRQDPRCFIRHNKTFFYANQPAHEDADWKRAMLDSEFGNADTFAVDRRTWAAWKAHRTMGTYDG